MRHVTDEEVLEILRVAEKALEKQIEIEVLDTGDDFTNLECPTCKADLFELNEDCKFDLKFCPECGQRIKLEEC